MWFCFTFDMHREALLEHLLLSCLLLSILSEPGVGLYYEVLFVLSIILFTL